MNDLDEATIRAHVRRRAGGPVEQAKVDGLTRSIMVRLDQRPRSGYWPFATSPMAARVGLVAVLAVAVSLIAVPLAGGPKGSMPPSAGAATEGSTAASTLDPNVLQVLSLDNLQRVVANGDAEPYAGRIVIAAVDLLPEVEQPLCVPTPCPVDGFVEGANPRIRVIQSAKDTDILRTIIWGRRIIGPVILRIEAENTVELIGDAPMAVGRVAWSLSSFVTAVQNTPRTMEFAPNRFLVGRPYVVDAQLVRGDTFYCALQTPASNPRLNGFACGATAWLAPSEVQDPTTIVDGWTSRPPDWVRIQNGAYSEFSGQQTQGAANPKDDPVRGFYLVFPVLKINPAVCFQCDAGAVAILYAKLEPVRIP